MLVLQKRFWVILLVVCVSGVNRAGACLWVSGTMLDGKYSSHLSGFNADDAGLFEAYKTEPKVRFKDALAGAAEDGNDAEYHAVQQVVDGNYQQAISGLLKIEKDEGKKLYSVASNLGTAYELNGDLENAREWIAEGISRNEDSHHGSEWVHLYILDFKCGVIKEKFSELMSKNSEGEYVIDIYGKTYEQGDVYMGLMYQLNERLVFVKKDSPVVADLLLSLSKIEAKRSGLEAAVKVLALAEKYGDEGQVEKLVKTRNEYEILIVNVPAWEKMNPLNSTDGKMGVAIVLFFVGILVVIYFLVSVLRGVLKKSRMGGN